MCDIRGLSVYPIVKHWESAAVSTKTAEPIVMSYGTDSPGPEEACIRCGSRSDESICRRGGNKTAMRPFVRIL